MKTRLIYPEDYLTPEMAKLARSLGFVDDRPVRAFNHRELSAIRTAGMRVHYELLGRGWQRIVKIYGCTNWAVGGRLNRAGVQSRPRRHLGKLRIFRLGIEQAQAGHSVADAA